jgi:hypothetical protein
MSTQRERMYLQIRSHGQHIQAIFGIGGDPVELSKRLRRIEAKAHALTTRVCNGQVDIAAYDAQAAKILNSLDTVLGFRAKGIPVFLDGDPRGYALKIDDEYTRSHNLRISTDWGGFGLVAPEFKG